MTELQKYCRKQQHSSSIKFSQTAMQNAHVQIENLETNFMIDTAVMCFSNS